MNVRAITGQSERQCFKRSTHRPAHKQEGNLFVSFLHNEIYQNMVASSMHFGYRMLTDLLEIQHIDD